MGGVKRSLCLFFTLKSGLDVVTKEPIEQNNPLLSVKNKQRLLLTPHIAWASIEARKRLIEKVAKNIEDFLK